MMKKVVVVLFVMLLLMGCESSYTKTTGVVKSVEKCGQVATSIVHMEDGRSFKLKGTRCNVINEGVELEFGYNSLFQMEYIKYVEKNETKGEN